MTVIIVKKNGERYETPKSNLENVRRLIDIQDIIYPGEEGEEATEVRTKDPKPVVKGKGKK